MKSFTKSEMAGLAVIFFILVAVCIPNFAVSIRRARDQVRRDDLGAIRQGLVDYNADFQQFPLASSGGKILACKTPNEKVAVGAKGELIVHLIPCEWAKNGIVDLTPGSSKVYLKILGIDPDSGKGASYRYMSDGQHFQIYTAFEGKDEADYDSKIVARNLMCGNKICNVGQSYGVPTGVSIEEYDLQIQNAKIKN